MEMKDRLYPTLPNERNIPTAPDIEMEHVDDGGHSYRLKVISDVEKFLEDEITKRDAFSKKVFPYSEDYQQCRQCFNYHYIRSRSYRSCIVRYRGCGSLSFRFRNWRRSNRINFIGM